MKTTSSQHAQEHLIHRGTKTGAKAVPNHEYGLENLNARVAAEKAEETNYLRHHPEERPIAQTRIDKELVTRGETTWNVKPSAGRRESMLEERHWRTRATIVPEHQLARETPAKTKRGAGAGFYTATAGFEDAGNKPINQGRNVTQYWNAREGRYQRMGWNPMTGWQRLPTFAEAEAERAAARAGAAARSRARLEETRARLIAKGKLTKGGE